MLTAQYQSNKVNVASKGGGRNLISHGRCNTISQKYNHKISIGCHKPNPGFFTSKCTKLYQKEVGVQQGRNTGNLSRQITLQMILKPCFNLPGFNVRKTDFVCVHTRMCVCPHVGMYVRERQREEEEVGGEML